MSLFEYAALLKIRFDRTRNVKTTVQPLQPGTRMTSQTVQKMVPTADEDGLTAEVNMLCAKVDRAALIIFVLAFFMASFIYWIWYGTKYE